MHGWLSENVRARSGRFATSGDNAANRSAALAARQGSTSLPLIRPLDLDSNAANAADAAAVEFTQRPRGRRNRLLGLSPADA